MKIRCYINFHVPREANDRYRILMEQIDCIDVWQEPLNERALPHMSHTFDSEEPRFTALMDLLKREKIDWLERIEHVYTTTELRAAPLLEFSAELTERDLGYSYPGQFDLSTGCPNCMTGSRQVGPVRVAPEDEDDEAGFPDRGLICQSMEFDYFVRGDLYEALVAADLYGLELMEAVSSTHDPLGWWQMIPRYVMPRMSPETRGIIRGRDKNGEPMEGCPHCDRDNYFHSASEPSQIAYATSSLNKELPDVAYTWECFDLSYFESTGHIARPRLLVSPKMFDIFRKFKVRSIKYFPVRFVDV